MEIRNQQTPSPRERQDRDDEIVRDLARRDRAPRPEASRPGHEVHVVGVAAEGAGTAAEALGMSGVAVAGPLGPIGAAIGGFCAWLGARAEGEALAEEHRTMALRGALAALEGRTGPEVLEMNATNTDYRLAYERVLRASQGWPNEAAHARFERLRDAVLAAKTEGRDAVATGRDHGVAFERRYETDLAFRHGVDAARRMPTEQIREIREQIEEVELSRRGNDRA